ncbi:MAG: CdaR family protein [Phascolarctobacterium sp.]|nr:CdaR family protein [Phascolarctobacterium sp.]
MNIFDKIYEFFRRDDLGAKVISLFLAIGLWYYVMNEQNPVSERIVEVNLNQLNQSQDHIITDLPKKVAVTIRGPRININSNLKNKITASIDFKNAKVGQQTFPVIVESTSGTVLSYSPSEVSVYVDTYSEKKVPVATRSVGKSADDLTLGKCVVEPTEVIVRGATRRVNAINKVIAPVDITGQTEPFQTESELIAVNEYGADVHNMSIEPAKAIVNAQLVEQMHSLEIPVIANLSSELPNGVKVSKIEVVPNRIRVTAPPSIVDSLKEIKTKHIDASLLNGSTEIPCELDLPDRVLPETRTVKVRISVEPVQQVKEEKQDSKGKDETKN